MTLYQMEKKKVRLLNKNIKYYSKRNNKQLMSNYLQRKKLSNKLNKQRVLKSLIYRFYFQFLRI